MPAMLNHAGYFCKLIHHAINCLADAASGPEVCRGCADEPQWRQGRQLTQLSGGLSSNFTLQVMVAKCSGTQPVTQASVAALLNGYTATNLSLPLKASPTIPNLFQGAS